VKNIDQLAIEQVEGGVILPVKAIPGSSREKIVGVLGDSLKVATSAPPEGGKANKAIARQLGKTLGISTRDIFLESGPASARKRFRLIGLGADALRDKLQSR
jgi:hypothetical protein